MTKTVKPLQYLSVPMPLANGGDADPSPLIRSIEETPAPPGPAGGATHNTSSDALIEAANMVRRIFLARIAWHEKELKSLREALAPFGAASRQIVTPETSSGHAGVDALLRLADTFKFEEGDTP